jgi:tetratricopeptide (TPR) repeat protein
MKSMGQAMGSGKSAQAWLPSLILALLCGVAAYSDSFRGPFIFDDIDAILRNPHVNRALPAQSREAPTTLSGRPVLWATFAGDFAVGGLRVEVYHLTNLAIHLCCGGLLFGIVRRNLLEAQMRRGRFTRSAAWLAGAVTAVWLVHPLGTEAVTYTVQRAESLTALFYLLVIYALIRDFKFVAALACALGMGTKEMMATAPLAALLYDRTFMAGSFREALRLRGGLYLALAATWIIPAIVTIGGFRSASVGNISPLDYLRTQLGVIAYYLWLMIWPKNLVLDYYDWPLAHSWSAIGDGGLAVIILAVFSLIAFWRTPPLGFLGCFFFLVLAPSSSIVPIFTEIAAEHRMYLPMIAPIALIVIGGWTLLSRTDLGVCAAGILLTAALAALAARTFLRNREYQDARAIWQDNVALRPHNPRAHFNLGYTELGDGDPASAAGEFRRALELEPNYLAAYLELARAMELLRLQGGAVPTQPDESAP